MEENKINKRLYKMFMLVTKITPMLLAFTHFINCVTSYFNCTIKALNYVGGVSILTLVYLYITSYTFKLCSYYRMFLHYCLIIDIISTIDYYIGIPINNFELLMLYSIISIITMFVVLYLKIFK